MLGFVGKLAFGTIKFGVKHIVVPIAISAATAAVAGALAEKIRPEESKSGAEAMPRSSAIDPELIASA